MNTVEGLNVSDDHDSQPTACEPCSIAGLQTSTTAVTDVEMHGLLASQALFITIPCYLQSTLLVYIEGQYACRHASLLSHQHLW